MERFLDHHGEAAHHITFNVPNLARVRSRLREAGFRTVREDLDFPDWQELFLPPDHVHGLLIQIASTPNPIRTEALVGTRDRNWSALPNNRGARDPGWWESLWETAPACADPADRHNAALGPVVIGTRDPASSDLLFRQILHGIPEACSEVARLLPSHGWARKYTWRTGAIIVVEGAPGVHGALITQPESRSEPTRQQVGNVRLTTHVEDLMSMPNEVAPQNCPPDSKLVQRLDDHPHVAHVVINRPDVRNAINSAVARQLADEFRRCDEDPNVRVIVLSGSPLPDGRGAFSAGLDLKAFAATGDVGETPDRGFAGLARHPPTTPIIAAVEGFAVAGGFEIALACDMVVAAEDARFGLPEVSRGLVADGGSLLRLPERIPAALAMELALSGEDIPAVTLERLGIVNRVVPSGEAVQVAHELAASIARNAPLALTATKRILSRHSAATCDEAWAEQQRIATPVWRSADAHEGATAFAEKRDPKFLGK
nr:MULTISPECIES: crotonase/enoyl-CoA hydratase family protein [Prauserella salsuginis group]